MCFKLHAIAFHWYWLCQVVVHGVVYAHLPLGFNVIPGMYYSNGVHDLP